MDSAGLEWNRRGEAVPVLSGADASLAPREPFEVSGVSATAALYRREALEAVATRAATSSTARSSRTTRTSTCRCVWRAPAGDSLRSARRRPPRGLAHGAPHAVSPRALDGAQPLAHALSQLHARAASRAHLPALLRADLAHARAVGVGGIALPLLVWPRLPWMALAVGAGVGAALGMAVDAVLPMIGEVTAILVSWNDGAGRARGGRRARSGAREDASAGGAERRSSSWTTAADVAFRPTICCRCGRTRRCSSTRRTAASGRPPTRPRPGARATCSSSLNPDTRAEGEPFTPIARGLRGRPRVVAVAPRLVEMEDGAPAGGVRTISRLAPPGREDQATFQLRRLPDLASDATRAAPVRPRSSRTTRRADARATRDGGPGAPLSRRAGRGRGARRAPRRLRARRRLRRALRPGLVRGRRPVRAPGGGGHDRLSARGARPAPRRRVVAAARLRPVPPDLLPQRAAVPPEHYGPPARCVPGAARRRHALRLAILPFRREVPRPRPEAARAYLRAFSRRRSARSSARGRPPTDVDVSIVVVSYDDAADLRSPSASALAQRGVSVETLVVDNASRDDSREVAARASAGACGAALRERRLRRGDERRHRRDERGVTCSP